MTFRETRKSCKRTGVAALELPLLLSGAELLREDCESVAMLFRLGQVGQKRAGQGQG